MNNKKLSLFISKKIIKLRESVEWSQSELSRQSGVTSAAISQIEKGDRMPSLVVIQKLADALNVSVAELTGSSTTASGSISEEAQVFLREFFVIKNLSKEDKKIIKTLAYRLTKNKL